MALQGSQIVEGIPARKLARVDQTHEEIAHVRAVERPIEVGIFSVKNGLLQTPLDALLSRGRPAGAERA